MLDPSSEESLDALLRDVAVPDDLLARLRGISTSDTKLLTDQELDRLLRDVVVPKRLQQQLLAISRYSDEEIDGALRSIPEPSDLVQRLREKVGAPKGQPLRLFLLAASILVVASTAFLAITQRNGPAAGRPTAQSVSKPSKAAANHSDPAVPDAVASGGSKSRVAEPEVRPKIAQDTTGADLEAVAAVVREHAASNDSLLPDLASSEPQDDRDVDSDAEASALSPPTDRTVIQKQLFGADGSLDEAKDLEVIEAMSLRGFSPPRIRQFDHMFLQRHGVHPRVNPSAHESLRKSQIPIVTDTLSFDRLRLLAATGTAVAPQLVNVEEILAAIDYNFPAPTNGPLGIRIAAGPSVFGEAGMSLVQVGVQTLPVLRDPNQGTWLTIGVDTSASMGLGGKLTLVQRALKKIVRRLGPHDRLSLVAFGEEATVLIENGRREDSASLETAIETLRPVGATNIGSGVHRAVAAAVGPALPDNTAARVMIFTDGLAGLKVNAVAALQSVAHVASVNRAELHLVDLGTQSNVDPKFGSIAESAGGRLRHVSSTAQADDVLLEVLAGRTQHIAANVKCEVDFNPAAVASYRLIGHEARTGAGLVRSEQPVELKAGQAAVGVYEVALKPDGSDDVATVTLTWRDPADNSERTAIQRISRLQFARTFEGAPLSLQAAALVAETAQVLRQSYFAVGPSHSLDRVLDMSRSVNPRLQSQQSFRDFLKVVKLMTRSRAL